MLAFKDSKLIKDKNGEFTVVIYLKSDIFFYEFADEINSKINDNQSDLNKNIISYIKTKYPNIKINLIKVMVGTILVGAISLQPLKTYAYNKNVSIILNGSEQKYNQDSIILNNTTFVPIRGIAESIGANVWWNSGSKTVGIIKGNTNIAFVVGSNTARVNGRKVNMPKSFIINSTTMVPLRFVSEILGIDVKWDATRRAAILTTNAINKSEPPKQNITTYIVQDGDTLTTVSKKFGVPIKDIQKYNYMQPNEFLNAGEKIYINGYAPRDYAVTKGESSSPASVGKLVDWYRDGQYILNRGDVFTITDVDSGRRFKVKMIGGYNHCDIEPLTTEDTNIMKKTFINWKWSPRAVVIYKDGMNIAGSLSGMPHSFDIVKNNGVTGHFDLYLLNSKPHGSSASDTYLQQHKDMVYKAAGK